MFSEAKRCLVCTLVLRDHVAEHFKTLLVKLEMVHLFVMQQISVSFETMDQSEMERVGQATFEGLQ